MKINKLNLRFIIGLIVAAWYFLIQGISPLIIFHAIKVFLLGTIYFNGQQIGSLVLINSIVGLGVIVSVYAVLFSDKKRKVYLTSGWMTPTVSFIYAILFSIIKLLTREGSEGKLGEGITTEMVNGLGHLSFVYFIIGLIALTFWFINLIKNISKK